MNKETRRTCLYMGMGVLLYEIILSLAAIPFAGIMKYSVYPIELGILIGSVLVIGMVIEYPQKTACMGEILLLHRERL